jgi:hypothetical protein
VSLKKRSQVLHIDIRDSDEMVWILSNLTFQAKNTWLKILNDNDFRPTIVPALPQSMQKKPLLQVKILFWQNRIAMMITFSIASNIGVLDTVFPCYRDKE